MLKGVVGCFSALFNCYVSREKCSDQRIVRRKITVWEHNGPSCSDLSLNSFVKGLKVARLTLNINHNERKRLGMMHSEGFK